MKKFYSVTTLILVLLFAGCQPTGRQAVSADPWVDFENHVTVSIYCNTVLDNWDSLDPALQEGDYIPQDGVMLAETQVGWEEGDTVFSALQRLDEAGLITLDYGTDASMGPYVDGINYLYNGNCGEFSGWLFSINGAFPNTGCDQNVLEAGDDVKWLFSCDMGPDVGNDWTAE